MLKKKLKITRVAITGSHGFLGWHLKAYLLPMQDVEIIDLDRTLLNDYNELKKIISKTDVIVHLAGLNKAEDEKMYRTNVGLTEKIVNICNETNSFPYIIFSSSTHYSGNSAYGKSKKDSMSLLRKWATDNNAQVCSLILPNVFGEFGKPFYNSVVSTFCHQLVAGDNSEINNNGRAFFIYVQDVAKGIYRLIKNHKNEDILIPGMEMKISKLYNKLKYFSDSYNNNIIPNIKNNFHRNLFNTYISHLVDRKFFPRGLELKTDNRGFLFEMIKQESGGQVFFSSTKVGIIKGNHYHRRKIERFCVVQGSAEIKIRKIMSSDIITYKVDADKPVFIDIPTFYTHNISNVGKNDLLTVFWTNEIFNPEDPDTFPEIV